MDTTVFSEMNWLAVLVGAIAYFALGAIWYSFLFQKQWIAYQGIDVNDPEMKKGVATTMISSFVLMFIASVGLGILAERMELTEWMSGAKLGLLTGICFSFTAISITYLYTKKPFGLHLIDGLYHIVGQILAGIIICIWQ